MIVQLLAVTALLFGLGQPVATTPTPQDEEAAWTRLYEIVPQHVHSMRGRVRITETPDLAGLAERLGKLVEEIGGTAAEPLARFYLGNALFKLDRFDEAVAVFEGIARAFPDHALTKALGRGEASPVAAALADCREEIETRKIYRVTTLPHAELDRMGRAVFHTAEGAFEIQLFSEASPETCANFKKLVQEGYYIGIACHEMQSYRYLNLGCPNTRDEMKDWTTWGQGGPAWDLPFELNDATHMPGTVSMKRAADGRSHGSQFTICLSDQPELNNKQVVFGRVVRGLDVLRRLSQRRVDPEGHPEEKVPVTGTEWLEGPAQVRPGGR